MEIQGIGSLGPTARRALFERDAGIDSVRNDVESIVDRIREEGDVAVREFTREFDGIDVGNLDVTDDAERAVDEIDDNVRTAIETAKGNIEEFHEALRPEDWQREFAPGRTLGRRFRPIERIGAYVPGGTAAYPSSALMTVVPAVVAGVDHIVVTTPPGEPTNPVTLAAVHLAGADAVYSVGGAQAIAALAYGTESIPRVEKVVGPGNRWVTAAKAVVSDDVAIDFLAGPSELLVIADATADPSHVAWDLIAQAEHDPNAAAVAVTTDEAVAEAIIGAIDERLETCSRRDTVEAALGNDASGLFVARSMSEAVLFADAFAPEHLSIQAEDDEEILDRIDSAGSVFLGPMTPVAAGDYASGTNHVLPTNGLARVTGGLSTESFLRSTTVQRLSREGLASLSETITTLAREEGLDAHASSVARRLD